MRDGAIVQGGLSTLEQQGVEESWEDTAHAVDRVAGAMLCVMEGGVLGGPWTFEQEEVEIELG